MTTRIPTTHVDPDVDRLSTSTIAGTPSVNSCTLITTSVLASQKLVREAQLLQIIQAVFKLRMNGEALNCCHHMGMPFEDLGMNTFLYNPMVCLAWLYQKKYPNPSTNDQELP